MGQRQGRCNTAPTWLGTDSMAVGNANKDAAMISSVVSIALLLLTSIFRFKNYIYNYECFKYFRNIS